MLNLSKTLDTAISFESATARLTETILGNDDRDLAERAPLPPQRHGEKLDQAELRYRELFDNIQEGLFFSTPGGRFIEVNDAMVRMLGYPSREELLRVDIAAELYFSPQQRERQRPGQRGVVARGRLSLD